MQKSAADLGRQIRDGRLDPVELTENTISEIDKHPHRDTIFTIVTKERALAEAQAAKRRQSEGALLGPLDGVPISWKDLFDTKGIVTEAGSPLLKGRIPEKDCVVLDRATQQGLVCVGKTHMSELAFSGLGINPNAATPPNINGADLIPGGSSSGAAASVVDPGKRTDKTCSHAQRGRYRGLSTQTSARGDSPCQSASVPRDRRFGLRHQCLDHLRLCRSDFDHYVG